ncbi:methylglyoxal reductase (NADPH-dependent) gre2 [Coniosporium tulheliwenetii]|uniref:Methylglyoxal reductase (NADPH-dependent) gre2 n=1 Tax=Coniosporium tulheliwenetii TaxID=3383036 RepID=A0ACC2ZM63_9PEZI|nr:methylglyoxal reductase (NADPH-dependent) gre2 [Cladosporium sp. JES 115]
MVAGASLLQTALLLASTQTNLTELFGQAWGSESFFSGRGVRPNLFQLSGLDAEDYEHIDVQWGSEERGATFDIPHYLDFVWDSRYHEDTVTGESKQEYQTHLSMSMGLNASIDGFGIETNDSFEETNYSETWKKYASVYRGRMPMPMPRGGSPAPASYSDSREQIGQAVELDTMHGAPPPVGNNYGLRDSDGDVQGMVGLQQGLAPQERRSLDGPASPTSAHSQEYDVVLAVRTESKGREVLDAHKNSNKLSYVVVGDIAAPGAFDKAVQANPPFEGVIHAASPFHFRSKNFKSEILDPAVQGTTGILKAIKQHAPSVKKIVITSSMAAVLNPFSPPLKYTEETWNPITEEQALSDPVLAYLGSKTFAERAAWEFVKKELPNVGLATINPPAVLGPVIHHLDSLDSINTSNQAIADVVQGKWKNGAPPTFTSPWVDVRDVALAHVLALEKPEASGTRFLLNGGFLTHADYVAIAKEKFPSLRDRLPEKVERETPKDPAVDTEPSEKVLGFKYKTLEESVTDTISSLLRFVQ